MSNQAYLDLLDYYQALKRQAERYPYELSEFERSNLSRLERQLSAYADE